MITSINKFRKINERITKINQFIQFLSLKDEIEIIDIQNGFSIPIRKDDWFHPDDYIAFKIGEYTFAMYLNTKSTPYKTRGFIYIIPIFKSPAGWVESGTYGGISIKNIPGLKENPAVKTHGSFSVLSNVDINTFIDLVIN